MKPQPFTIQIPQPTLDDLQQRLAATRWPDEVADSGWDFGTNEAYLKELVAYWQAQFDWRQQEAALNRFAHFRTEIDGYGLHFIHERGQGERPLPLLLSHGWPDSFYRFYKLIPLLTDPESHGGRAEDAFDVVVPSLPGFGFSDRITQKGADAPWTAGVLHQLMTKVLGYHRFAAHGGDVGSGITEALAMGHPDSLVGIHLTDIPYWHIFATQPDELSKPEQKFLETGQQWQMTEGAYALIQATKPQTLAYGLNDSPAGLAAWILEKFRTWSDCDGNPENRFTKDELLTNIFLYWATETVRSSFTPYFGTGAAGPPKDFKKIEVPTGAAIFPKDIVPAPREFAERFYTIARWTEMPKGGHFSALEEPELLADEIRAFFRPLREKFTS
ncbi:epoxide hydrolase [Larkinella ripae]